MGFNSDISRSELFSCLMILHLLQNLFSNNQPKVTINIIIKIKPKQYVIKSDLNLK